MSSSKPSDCDWLSQRSFDVLSSVCQVFIPAINTTEISNQFFYDNLLQVIPNLPKSVQENPILSQNKDVNEYLERGALEMEIPKAIAYKVQKYVTTNDKMQLSVLLWLLSYTFGTFLLTGYWKPFPMLSKENKKKAMMSWKYSKFLIFRAVYQTLKRLNGLLYFSYNEHDQLNPNWKALKYDPTATISKQSLNPSPKSNSRDKFTLSHLLASHGKSKETDSKPIELTTEVIIVGSGSGGGTIASELCKAGLKVIVLEKGGYFNSTDFKNWKEYEAYNNTYEKGGLVSSSDGAIAFLAGSCVGGGSTINWNASFRTPKDVLRDWEAMGLSIFREKGEFEQSLDAVLELFHVNCNYSYLPRDENKKTVPGSFRVNLNNQLLYESAEKLGYTAEYVPRNVKNCIDCGHCNHGCPYDAKQSTITNLMQPLVDEGKLQVLANCYVKKILTKKRNSDGKKEAYGVECEVSDPNNPNTKPISLRILSKVVICSAGSIHTPAVLLRSKLSHDKIGRYFSCHPVVGVVGIFLGQKTDLDKGVSMGVVVRGKKSVDSNSPTTSTRSDPLIAIETPPIHPGSLGLVMAWSNSYGYKISTLFYENMAAFINIHRDISSVDNRIAIDSEGNPVIHYKITKNDKKNMLEALLVLYDLMYISKPNILVPASEYIPWYYVKDWNKDDLDSTGKSLEALLSSDTSYQQFKATAATEGISEGVTGVFSAHQMSSCRMASNSKEGPTKPTGELWECDHLYIADGSILPTSLGINPMITIAAFAHYVSRNVMKEFGVKPSSVDF